MNRKIVLTCSVSFGVLLGLTTLAMLGCKGSKVSVRFVNSEPSSGEFPSYTPSVRLDFAVENVGYKPASVTVAEIQDKHGTWMPVVRGLVDVDAGKNTQLYFYLPVESAVPSSARIRVMEKASAIQKIRFALELILDKASGPYSSKQVWFDELMVPAYELVVKLDKDA